MYNTGLHALDGQRHYVAKPPQTADLRQNGLPPPERDVQGECNRSDPMNGENPLDIRCTGYMLRCMESTGPI
jgi:hypothetical protein